MVSMARLIYSTIASLDGYIADTNGKFDWAAPDSKVHAFVNDLERPVGTYLNDGGCTSAVHLRYRTVVIPERER